ncbi:MAG: hypothetical protein ACREVV_02565 [Steroidobacteraceae bacterium]
MRTLWVVAAVCAMLLATGGCRHNKREPVPGPQVGAAAFRWAAIGTVPRRQTYAVTGERGLTAATRDSDSASDTAVKLAGPGGIAWFQGSVEEAFARADVRRSARQNTLHCASARKRPPAA